MSQCRLVTTKKSFGWPKFSPKTLRTRSIQRISYFLYADTWSGPQKVAFYLTSEPLLPLLTSESLLPFLYFLQLPAAKNTLKINCVSAEGTSGDNANELLQSPAQLVY